MQAFNATDSFLKSPVYEAACRCFWFLLVLWVNLKIQLYNQYGLNIQALSREVARVFISKLEEGFRNYSSSICKCLFFQGTKINWTIYSEGCVSSSLVKLSFIKQFKCLKLIPFAFGSCCCEPKTWGPRSSMEVKQTILRLKKENIHQRDSRNVRGGQINSLVHSKNKRPHWWSWELKKAWKCLKDSSEGWSQGLVHGEGKALHNIHPRKEQSLGSRCVRI